MKKKHIQVITDNSLLAERFEKEVWSLVDDSSFILSFCCSPFSKIQDFTNLHNSVSIIDLRKKEDLHNLKNRDLILSIHCKQLFPEELINSVRCINVHPGYNPINRGWYPQVFAIINDLEIGATIHEIDHEIDHGRIIARSLVPKYEYDTSLSLYNRVVDEEIKLLKKHIDDILHFKYTTFAPEKEGEIRLKKHFNELCELDLNKKTTIGEVIKYLRALTHGDYKNAYFYDSSNNKVFVSLNISKDDHRDI